MYDELWSEIVDSQGEIFDIIDEDNPENNVKCDEFAQENYTVWINDSNCKRPVPH